MKQPTFNQMMAFLKAGGKATFDGFRPDQQLFWRDGYILVTKSMFGHVDDKWGNKWRMENLMQNGRIPTLLPMENATKEAAKVWLELGGKVKATRCDRCEFQMVDEQVKNLNKRNRFASCCALVGKFNLLESEHTPEQKPEPAPATKQEPEKPALTAERIKAHLLAGGQVQLRSEPYRYHNGTMQYFCWCGDWHNAPPAEDNLDAFAARTGITLTPNLGDENPAPEPEPKPLTRLDVINHLKKGGAVQWKDGFPGTWIAKRGMLLWAAKDDVFYHISTHDHKGQWFADFTDEEIGHLELVPIAEKKPEPAPEKSPTRAEITAHLEKGGKVWWRGHDLYKLFNGKVHWFSYMLTQWFERSESSIPSLLETLAAARDRGDTITLLPTERQEPEKRPEPKKPTAAEIKAHLEKGGAIKGGTADIYKLVDGKPHCLDGGKLKWWRRSLAYSSIDELLEGCAKEIRDGGVVILLPVKHEPAPITPEQARAHLFKGGKVKATIPSVGPGGFFDTVYWMAGDILRASDGMGEYRAGLNAAPIGKWFTDSKITKLELL